MEDLEDTWEELGESSVLINNCLRTQGSWSRGVFRSSAGPRQLSEPTTRAEAVLCVWSTSLKQWSGPPTRGHALRHPILRLADGVGQVSPGMAARISPVLYFVVLHMAACQLSNGPRLVCFPVARGPRSTSRTSFQLMNFCTFKLELCVQLALICVFCGPCAGARGARHEHTSSFSESRY